MTDAHQDVAGVVAELRQPNLEYTAATDGDPDMSRYIRWLLQRCGNAADLIESLSKALSEAEAERDEEFNHAQAYATKVETEILPRLAAAESRLSEAMKVIEPFALIAEHDIGSGEADSDTYQPINCNTVPRISVGHLRAVRRFLNAGKDSSDAS